MQDICCQNRQSPVQKQDKRVTLLLSSLSRHLPDVQGQQPVVRGPQAVPSEGGESSAGRTRDGTSVLSCLKAGMGEKGIHGTEVGPVGHGAGEPGSLKQHWVVKHSIQSG